MKKNKKIALMAGVALVSGLSYTQREVAAEEVSKAVTPITNEESTAPVTAESTAKQEAVTTEAETSLKQTQAELAQAEAAVSQAETDVQNATAENIAQAELAVQQAQEAIAPLEANKQAADDNLKQAQEAEGVKAQELATSKEAVAQAESDLSASQKTLEAAQNAVDGVTETPEVVAARKDLAPAQAKVAEQEAAFKAAQAAAADRQTKIQTAQADISRFKNEVASAQSKVQALSQVRNTFTISGDFINALSTFRARDGEPALAKLKTLGQNNYANNNYVSNSKDAARTVDVDNLPDDVRLDLGYYAQDLLNQIHQQFGSGQVRLSQNAIQFTQAVSDELSANQNQPVNGVSQNQANQYGFEKYKQHFVEVGNGTPYMKQASVDELKRQIYDLIKRNLFQSFEKNDFVKANAIAGVSSGQVRKDPYYYTAVDFASRTSGITDHNLIQLLLTPAEYVLDQAKQGASLTNNLYSNPGAEADAAQKALAAAQAKLIDAEKALEQAQSIPDETNLAQMRLDNAKQALAGVQAKYDKALADAQAAAAAAEQAKFQALAKAKEDVRAKETGLATAQTKRSQAEQALVQAGQAVLAAQAGQTSAAADLSQALTKLGTAKDYLKRLTNAPALLEEASRHRTAVTNRLADSQARYNSELAKLNRMKAVLALRKTLSNQGVEAVVQASDAQKELNLSARALTAPADLNLGLADYDLYDIRLLETSGREVQPTSPVLVRLPKDSGKEVEAVYYVAPTGLKESLPYRLSADGRFVEFEASHFSYYAIAYRTQAGQSSVRTSVEGFEMAGGAATSQRLSVNYQSKGQDQGSQLPETGEVNGYLSLYGAGLISMMGMLVLSLKKKN